MDHAVPECNNLRPGNLCVRGLKRRGYSPRSLSDDLYQVNERQMPHSIGFNGCSRLSGGHVACLAGMLEHLPETDVIVMPRHRRFQLLEALLRGSICLRIQAYSDPH